MSTNTSITTGALQSGVVDLTTENEIIIKNVSQYPLANVGVGVDTIITFECMSIRAISHQQSKTQSEFLVMLDSRTSGLEPQRHEK